jgi:tetratricopeptide (TPR) repeat protein
MAQSTTGATLSLPPVITDAIAERLDRLSAPAHQLATVAAMIGRTFEFELVRRVCGFDTADAAAGVEELVARQILHVVGEQLDFTHDRIRDVTHVRVLAPRRQLLHGAVGEALETLYAGHLDEICDRLAFHFSRSARADKAVQYLARSAELAATAYAYAEEVAVLDEGIRQAQRLGGDSGDRWVVTFALRRAYSHTFMARWRDILEFLVPHSATVERLADPGLSSAYFFRVGMCHFYLGDPREAFGHGQRARAEASKCSDPAHVGRAHHLLGLAAYLAGRFADGAEHGRLAVDSLAKTRERYRLGLAYYVHGLNLALLGKFDAAVAAGAQIEQIAAEIRDPRLACWGPYVSGVSHTLRGDAQAGIRDLRRAVDSTREPLTSSTLTVRLAWAYLESGDAKQAIPLLESAIALIEAVHYRSAVGQAVAFLAEARLRAGDLEQAKALGARALSAATKVAHPYGVALAHRALGCVAAATNELAAARHHFTEAHTLFAEMPAPVDLGSVSLALADVASRSSDPAEAAAHLAEAYQSFRGIRSVAGLERSRALAQTLGIPLSED